MKKKIYPMFHAYQIDVSDLEVTKTVRGNLRLFGGQIFFLNIFKVSRLPALI